MSVTSIILPVKTTRVNVHQVDNGYILEVNTCTLTGEGTPDEKHDHKASTHVAENVQKLHEILQSLYRVPATH